jgi:2-phosphosulfolactate phosphatase
MSREIYAHFLPALFEPNDLQGGIAVVIDVLRASTTLCHALAAGANAVVPCEEVEEARELASNLQGEPVVLGGERHCQIIEGFDFGNSPFSYTPESVGDKTLVFTSTNGTRALKRASRAERVLLGTFNNLSAIVGELGQSKLPVHFVCAGTQGKISAEDILFAGAVIERLNCEVSSAPGQDDQPRLAVDFYQRSTSANDLDGLLNAIRGSLGGRNLRSLGMDADIERAAEIDRFDFVPVYSHQNEQITK